MDLYTKVHRFHRLDRIPIAVNFDETFSKNEGFCERLRIIFLTKGTGIVRVNQTRIPIITPAILCINDEEKINLESEVSLRSQSIYFHPEYINGHLSLKKIREREREEVVSTSQDKYLFQPFVDRTPDYCGYISIDPIRMNDMLNLYRHIETQVTEQSHRLWSCTARSYFLELLFMLVRVYQAAEKKKIYSYSK